jgi:hypothetical protein
VCIVVCEGKWNQLGNGINNFPVSLIVLKQVVISIQVWGALAAKDLEKASCLFCIFCINNGDMKNIFTSLACIFLCSVIVSAQVINKLSPVATELFKGVKTATTVDEKNFLAKQTAFVLSGNKGQPFALDKDSKEYPFAVTVMPTDLNKDGKEEVFIGFGNGYTSGNTGSSIVLYIKNAAGKYEMNLGFPGMIPDVLTTVYKGYPDLVVGGPGFEFPVFRWNGKIYDNYRTINDSVYGKTKMKSVGELSKEYQKTLK